MMDHLLLFILLALFAEILGTIGGFGSSLFFIPIATLFLDIHSVLGVTALFHVSSNITKIAVFRKGVDKKLILNIGIPAVVFVIIGAYFSKYINAKLIENILAVFLIITSLTFIIFKNISVKPTKFNSITGGVFSGFIAGLIGTGGAIRGITLAAFNLQTEVFIATSSVIDLGIDLSRSVVYSLNGFVHKDDLYLIPILLVVSILGTLIGQQILKKIKANQFKSIVLFLILITGLISLSKNLF
jgi:uncharacterized membrane protein YfcA